MTDYKYDYQLDDDINKNYMNYGITTCLVNGYIYRGDDHKNIVLSGSPKFYGTHNSASLYVKNDEYLKRYSTVKSLRLLKLTNDATNTKSILNFFTNVVLQKETRKTDIKISIILIQILFGIVDKKLEKMDLSSDIISTYLKSNGISDTIVELFIKVVEDLENENSMTIPSRCSIRPLDKLLMKLLKKYLEEYEIDGTYYFPSDSYQDPKIKESPDLLCNKIDNNCENCGSTCVPSEICIFNPSVSLGGVIIWKKVDGMLRRAFFHKKFKGYIRKNYDKLSIMDIYLLSKLYQNKKKFN